MVPYIGKIAVEQKRWLDDQTFREGVALCQAIPGATAMQTAAYVLLTVIFRFALNIPWDVPRVLLAAAAFVALLFKVEIIWIVLVGTVASTFLL